MASFRERQASAYAEHHVAKFISRYIRAARAGRADVIPQQWRQHVQEFVRGVPHTKRIDLEDEVGQALYDFWMQHGNAAALPPEF